MFALGKVSLGNGDEKKVKQTYTVGEVVTKTYTFASGSNEVESDGTTEVSTQYYSIGGISIAMKKGSELVYFLTDHLGSVVGVTDNEGVLTSETCYTPFGEGREDVGTITETDFGYTYQKVVTGIRLTL